MQLLDPSLEERIEYAVDDSPYLNGSSIQVEPATSRIVVRGVVGSYYEKQMAQETLLRIDGVESVENHLEVIGRRRR